MADIYFGNAAAGSNNGTSCANQFAWNDVSNGINVSGQQAAGNNLHICGTITLTANTNFLTAVNSGSSGNPITVKFENGSILQAPYWPGSNTINSGLGAIVINKNFWTIDGGGTGNPYTGSFVTGGTLQATANGTGLANMQPSNGIVTTGATSLTVKNLLIQNLYVHQGIVNPTSTSGTGTTATLTCANAGCGFATGQTARIDSCSIAGYNVSAAVVTVSGNTIQYSSTGTGAATGCQISDEQVNELGNLALGVNLVNCVNCRVTNNIIHDVLDGVYLVATGGAASTSNLEIDRNEIYNCNIMVDGGPGNGTSSVSGLYIHNNLFHDMLNWDEGQDNSHHNFIHVFAATTGASIDTIYVYNNVMYGDPGIHMTTGTNIEPTSGGVINTPVWVFNNVVRIDSATCSHTDSAYAMISTIVSGMGIVNNSMFGPGTCQSPINGGLGSESNGGIQQNNIVVNWGWAHTVSASVTTWTLSNNWYQTHGGFAAQHNSPFTTYTLATWQTLTGGDATTSCGTACSFDGTAPNVQTVAPWKPNVGSGVIGKGANLFSTCNGQPVPGLGALCSDINGVSRPNAAWDIGAAQFATSQAPGNFQAIFY